MTRKSQSAIRIPRLDGICNQIRQSARNPAPCKVNLKNSDRGSGRWKIHHVHDLFSGQLLPDIKLSFSSAIEGAIPSLAETRLAVLGRTGQLLRVKAL